MPEKQNLSSEQLPAQTRQGGGKAPASKILQKSQDWCLSTSGTLEISLLPFHGRFVPFSASLPRKFPNSCVVNLSLGIGREKLQQHQTSPAQGNPNICSMHSKPWKTAAQQEFHREYSAARLRFSSLVRIHLLLSWKHSVTEAPHYSWLSMFLCPLAGWMRLQNMQEKAWKTMDRWENCRSLLEQLPGSCCFVLCFPALHPGTRSLLSSRSRCQGKRISYSSQP